MLFSGLKLACESAMDQETGKFVERVENRQRVNFSAATCAMLRGDVETFHIAQPTPEAPDEGLSYIVSRIVIGFGPIAAASVGQNLAERMREVHAALAPLPDAERERALQQIAAQTRGRLLEEAEERALAVKNKGKGTPKNVRLNADCLRYLQSEQGMLEAEFYDDNIGKYVKAVVEEYAELPYILREKHFLRTHFADVSEASKAGKILKLTLYGTHAPSDCFCRPLAIMPDGDRMYHYLVGMVTAGKHADWRIQSIRLSAIAKIDEASGSGKLTRSEQEALYTAIAEKGVQFLSGTCADEPIAVRLDAEGERMYRRNLRLRPRCLARRADGAYLFSCTMDQAEYYFFKFGHHAVVCAPAPLAAKFARKYASAAARYAALTEKPDR